MEYKQQLTIYIWILLTDKIVPSTVEGTIVWDIQPSLWQRFYQNQMIQNKARLCVRPKTKKRWKIKVILICICTLLWAAHL